MTTTHTYVSTEELWSIPFETTKPAISTLPSPPCRKGPAYGSNKAWLKVILDEPYISVLLRVLPPQVSENTAFNIDLYWLYTQPSSSITPAQW